MERFREDLGCACSSGGNIAIGYFEVARESGSRLRRIALWDYYKAGRKLGQKQSQNSTGHNSDQSHVQPRSKRATGKSKRRTQGFDIFISIVELY